MNYQHLNAEEYINQTLCYGTESLPADANPLHIAYGIDKNFLFGCGVSIASILLNNRELKFIFHVFIDILTEDERKNFAQLAADYNTCIYIHVVNCQKLASFPTTKNWSVATYFRFIIGDYFIGQQDRILFMDADIMCQGNMSELFTLPLEDKVAAVVPERDKVWWQSRAQGLECPELENGYFNAGLLLINVSAWAQEYVSAKALTMLSDKNIASKLSYLDQDLLNITLAGKVEFIDYKFNTQFSLNYELKSEVVNPITDETVLIHFIGPTKPWHEWANYPSAAPFKFAKQHSPWKNRPLMKASNSNYARYCAKHCFKQGNVVGGIKSYLYYGYLKITK